MTIARICVIWIVLLSTRMFAAEIRLDGVIRDFKRGDIAGGHPDFETSLSGWTTGMVQNTLPSDKVPVYVATPPAGGVQSAASFRQWYTDVPDVNQKKDLSLVLSNVGTGSPDLYRFASNDFFPIDNELWGNEGLSRNFHFTYAVNGKFTYEAGARFRFQGDDDLWLYIDNKLVVDLGGVHGALEQTLDLVLCHGQ